jgi:hypothetical protein
VPGVRDSELFVAAELVNDVEITDLNSPRSHDDTAIDAALKVAGTFHGAIVLASRFVQCNTNPSPDARDFGNRTNEFDSSATFKGALALIRGQEAATCIQRDSYEAVSKSLYKCDMSNPSRWNTSLFNLPLNTSNLLLLYAWGVGVESA